MSWHELLFAHWPLPVADVAVATARACGGRIPDGLEIDTFEQRAWLGIVPFRMSRVGLRWLPSWLGPHRFPELNVRTYVTMRGRPGVFFFSLDAPSRLAVRAARAWFSLRYFDARLEVSRNTAQVDYGCVRVHRGAPPAELALRYAPDGDVFQAAPDSLESWLTDRYRLYAVDRHGGVWVGEIHHAPWPLQPARAEITHNSYAAAAGLQLEGAPALLHYAHELDVVAWGPRRVE